MLFSSSSSTSSSSLTSIPILATIFFACPTLISASLDCENVVAKGKHFNLKELGGPHQVHYLLERDVPTEPKHNFTFTVDLCHKLKWAKGGSPKTECPHGTRICGIDEETSPEGNKTIHPIPIAGDYTLSNGRTVSAQWELLRDSGSHEDSNREGIRGELHGGKYPFTNSGNDQMAILELVCNPDKTGLEGDEKDDGEKEDDEDDTDEKQLERRDEEEKQSAKSLKFISYKMEEIEKKRTGVLRLEWQTKYACEGESDKPREGAGWGFFTWFIIILFLAVAAYLIFGSWLNYNRYGARGWDLLPHGDTIRDIPYILKDWARRVAGTIQGPGSRGGYSAV